MSLPSLPPVPTPLPSPLAWITCRFACTQMLVLPEHSTTDRGAYKQQKSILSQNWRLQAQGQGLTEFWFW